MNEVYILIITKEAVDTYSEVNVSVYRNMESALKAYGVSVDEAREETNENYGEVRECDEIATDTYRFFRIFDNAEYDSITIEVQTKEIIGDDSEDI